MVSDIGNFTSQVRDGVNGLHFRTGDPDDLARVVTEALADPERLAAMRIAAHQEYRRAYTPRSHSPPS